nr:hypothetical protein CFP56_79222 [Quercus suber]
MDGHPSSPRGPPTRLGPSAERQCWRYEQRSTNNDQRTTINEQRSTNNDQRTTINEQRSTNNDQRTTINEQRSDAGTSCHRVASRSPRPVMGGGVVQRAGLLEEAAREQVMYCRWSVAAPAGRHGSRLFPRFWGRGKAGQQVALERGYGGYVPDGRVMSDDEARVSRIHYLPLTYLT